MKVDLIDRMGTDLDVVNAARVSFDKESDWDHSQWSGETAVRPVLGDKDAKLISYLADHGHWSPFSHCYVKFRVKAPIFVARQLQKHTVGLAWNEVSRRYVDSEPEFYVPEKWRKRAENVKQGSSDEAAMDEDTAGFAHFCYHAMAYYQDMLDSGVCPEQARMILPQSMMTEWIWSGSLYAFARVCKLRLDSHTQAETREIAKHIANHLNTIFPVSTKALLGEEAALG